MEQVYLLSGFTEEEIELAKTLVAKALIGLVTVKAPEYTHQLFQSFLTKNIRSEDTFYFDFTIHTIGNDILAALGAARNEISQREAS